MFPRIYLHHYAAPRRGPRQRAGGAGRGPDRHARRLLAPAVFGQGRRAGAAQFRQLGKVGCGNELLFPTGGGRIVTLVLASAADRQALEFTPAETGEFPFACPHDIYRGVMTVRD